jgi:hypothetical protein
VRVLASIGLRKPDHSEQLDNARLDLRPTFDQAVSDDRFGDDACHAPARIEAGVWVLKNHLQISPVRQRRATIRQMRHVRRP